jgi:hypothetical protein
VVAPFYHTWAIEQAAEAVMKLSLTSWKKVLDTTNKKDLLWP